ncbi:MAG TPA: hypothetical protein VK956_02880 [Verrucomicrobium sp.]|nr:hypothetical protein [Verrucomicrobium sp.]
MKTSLCFSHLCAATIVWLSLAAIAAFLPLPVEAQITIHPIDAGPDEPPKLQAGLIVTEYPRHAKQADEKDNYNLPLGEFGDPVGHKYLVRSLASWTWNPERNAIASGYINIESDGDYKFATRSFYDRNLLKIGDQEVCGFRDGEGTVAAVSLKKGWVRLVCAGFYGGRGADGINVRWQPPGQRELNPIPSRLLAHTADASVVGELPPETPTPKDKGLPGNLLATHVITVTDDFIVEAYKNGRRIEARRLLDEIFGATVERLSVQVRPDDWLVFHVVNNRMRWGGAKYFAVAGCLGTDDFGFVSDPASGSWSVCDEPARARDFIRVREEGTEVRASPIAQPWADGDGHMRAHAGMSFSGKPIWGGASSTWIKYIAPKKSANPAPTKPSSESEAKPETGDAASPPPSLPAPTKKVNISCVNPVVVPQAQAKEPKALLNPTRWPVQILSAVYGTGGKNADVTVRVKELVETKRAFFAVNPPTLGADPNPYWNKGLHIVYMKDGVRREQHRNENEYVLPESFYGPQDAAELTKWLPASRWRSEKGELQFHANGTVTGMGVEGAPLWEAVSKKQIRITWSAERKVDYPLDYTWSSFHEAENASAVYHVVP